MSVTYTNLGSNSWEITYTAGESLANVMSEFDTRLASFGWSEYDASAGTNKKCWRAANADGTYKYVTIDWNTSGYVLLQLWESWNSGTHTGTNLAQVSTSDAAQARAATDYGQVIDLTNGGTLYVFANSKWLILLSYANSAYGDDWHNGWTGVVEIARTVNGDTTAANYPCAVWISSSYLNDHSLASSTGLYIMSFPKIFDGSTGNSASNRAIFMAPFLCLRFGPAQNFTSGGSYPMILGTDSFSNKLSSPIFIGFGDQANSPEYHGEVFGLQMLSQGTWLDTAQLKIDASYNYDKTGTLTDHWVILGSQENLPFAIPK